MDESESASGAGSSGGNNDGDSIKVFIRVRPLVAETTDFDFQTCLEVDKDKNAVVMRSKSDPKHFTFDEVVDHSVTQESVFCRVGKKMIDGCIKGYNGTIFAYGQTGSGKTFTMLGPHEDTANFQHELRGVIPRSFEYLFKLIKKEQEIQGDKIAFLCKCSFLEIYNEQIFDLLDTSTSSLQLRENIRRGVFVEGAHEQVVSNAHEAYQVLNRGWINRTVASTTMNHESSRSHAVFTVSIESKVNQNGVWNIKTSQLHLVDLAGSERQKDTNTTGQRLKEAGSINRSLSALGNVIMALVDITHGKTRHVPYRDSKLSFLLRDSLGGNSKTYIVACVHPGSKCFGETLSTLQFARRAKMIKNKAVVNEDTQGSITHLQAEIKRLKETLLQYQQNVPISIQVSELTGSEGDVLSPNKSSGDNSSMRFKSFFLEAMMFYNRSEAEKKMLTETVKKQQEVCNRKDQAVRQMKMVLKFREDALRKIEKAQKEKVGLRQDEKDDIIENLRSEIQALQAVIDHHPEVVRYQIDNESLKAEIIRLRSNRKSDHFDKQKQEELEKNFLQLQAESGETVKFQAPRKARDDNAMSATIERQKASLEKLQSDIETLRREMGDEMQRMQLDLIAKEAELVSIQKAKEELEKLFRAHQVRSQIERETRDDLHAETIKIITTPKKGGVKVRHSIGGVGVTGRPLTLSPLVKNGSGSTEMGTVIENETPPADWAEEQMEGLRDEITKLQDQSRALKMQLEEAGRNTVNLIQEKSLLEAEKTLREKLHLKESKSSEDKISELAAEVVRLTRDNSELKENDRILTSEIQDLRILNEAGDRKLTEVRNEAKDYKDVKEKKVSQVETQVMKLSLELSEVKEDLEKASEERDQLREREETLQATLEFNADQLKDTEEKVRLAREEIKRLETSLKVSTAKIEDLEHDREKLLAQLQQEAGVKEQQLMESLQTIDVLRNDVQVHQASVAEERANVARLEQSVSELNAECERLLRADLTKEEAISSMTNRVTELKLQLQEKECALEDAMTELAEVNQRNVELDGSCRSLEERLAQQKMSNEDAMAQLKQVVNAREFEYEMLHEDYQSSASQVDSLGTELANEVQKNVALCEKQKNLENDVVSLKNEIEKLHSQINDYKTRLEIAMNDKQELVEKHTEIAEHVAEKQQLVVRATELEQKLNSLQDAFDVISNQLDAAHKDVLIARAELEDGKKNVEQKNLELDAAQTAHCKMKLQFELDGKEWQERNKELVQQLITLEANVNLAETRAQSRLDNLTAENQSLKDEIASLKESQTEQEAETARLKECTRNVYAEMDKLSSQNEELQEEALRLKKVADKLEFDLSIQLNENAKLSGHQNHLQKIAYLDKLKDQLIKLEKDNRILSGSLEKCRCRQQSSCNATTPTRAPSALTATGEGTAL